MGGLSATEQVVFIAVVGGGLSGNTRYGPGGFSESLRYPGWKFNIDLS